MARACCQGSTARCNALRPRPFSSSTSRGRAAASCERLRSSTVARAEDDKPGESAAASSAQAPKVAAPKEDPVWVQREREEKERSEGPQELPFGLYLLFSSMVAIAAVGSIFEYANQNPIFGVVPPSSPFYAPILGIFVFTGFPMAAFLFYKAITSANAEADRLDRADGR